MKKKEKQANRPDEGKKKKDTKREVSCWEADGDDYERSNRDWNKTIKKQQKVKRKQGLIIGKHGVEVKDKD